ncbi:FecR family protein [Cytophaga sp. FL35]|uniref:FecR family protein n=1 Tax=Cytophaga sp. FL35 TaxID=1904456 RepID=UPI001653A44B|nr:FecR family protein [Cytophaga sp. FL35]MBC6999632.1 DUF4974 domain-containing protein [Cytophaga sp. FL35]
MVPKNIENSIVKFLSQSADVEDLNLLNTWLEDENNQAVFKAYVNTQFALNIAMHDPDLEKVRQELIKQIKKNTRPIVPLPMMKFMKYAAIALLFLGLGFLLKKESVITTEKVIIPRENTITLQLGNGQVQVISENENGNVTTENGEVVGQQSGNQLSYANLNTSVEPIMNTLTIPRGKRFEILLSDSTKVYLNAGSVLTYPSVFLDNKPREVQLVGEAFFEVSHNKERQFVVNSQELDVRVYGTKFNMANYPEDEAYEVVLVDGSVSMNAMGEGKRQAENFLEPGNKGRVDKRHKEFSSQKVNTELYTSWLQGNLVFRNETFENIIRKLERHYNVVIINNNKAIANETFNATVETEYETIEQVFSYFKKAYDVDYTIIENKIIVNENK